MQNNEMWLRNKDGGAFGETKFRLQGWYNDKLWTGNRGSEPLLSIVKYYKNNKGQWEICDGGFYYITLSTLLTDFILIDGPFDQELNKLTEQLADIWKNNLENTFKINGTLGDPIKPEDIGVEVIPQAEETNEESHYEE
jgi:hypothetical protein